LRDTAVSLHSSWDRCAAHRGAGGDRLWSRNPHDRLDIAVDGALSSARFNDRIHTIDIMSDTGFSILPHEHHGVPPARFASHISPNRPRVLIML